MLQLTRIEFSYSWDIIGVVVTQVTKNQVGEKTNVLPAIDRLGSNAEQKKYRHLCVADKLRDILTLSLSGKTNLSVSFLLMEMARFVRFVS